MSKSDDDLTGFNEVNGGERVSPNPRRVRPASAAPVQKQGFFHRRWLRVTGLVVVAAATAVTALNHLISKNDGVDGANGPAPSQNFSTAAPQVPGTTSASPTQSTTLASPTLSSTAPSTPSATSTTLPTPTSTTSVSVAPPPITKGGKDIGVYTYGPKAGTQIELDVTTEKGPDGKPIAIDITVKRNDFVGSDATKRKFGVIPEADRNGQNFAGAVVEVTDPNGNVLYGSSGNHNYSGKYTSDPGSRLLHEFTGTLPPIPVPSDLSYVTVDVAPIDTSKAPEYVVPNNGKTVEVVSDFGL